MSEKGHIVEDLNRLDAARRYLDLGWCVLPTRPGEKYPRLRSWKEYQDRLPTEAEVTTWFERWPDSELGVVTGPVSDLVVTDVDVGEDYAPVTIRVGALLETAPTELVARTPSGGAHLFHQHPGHPVSNAVGDGIDVRGDGGFVKLPLVPPDEPSQHDAEGRAWTHHGKPGPWSAALELDEGGTSKEDGPAASPVSELWKGVGKDRRNDSCARLAGSLARRGVPEEEAVEMLLGWNTRNRPPLGQHPEDREPAEVEIRRTVASVYGKEHDRRAAEAQSGETAPLTVLPFSEFAHEFAGEAGAWVVPEWLVKATILFVVGPPGWFKTWLLLDLTEAMATGSDFLGQFPIKEPGPVLLFQQEDHHPQTVERLSHLHLAKRGASLPVVEDGRFRAPLLHESLDNVHVHPYRRLRLGDDDVLDEVWDLVDEIRPKLLVLDPLYSAGDLDDYLAGSAQRALFFKDLRDQFGVTLAVGHHVAKELADTTDRRRTWGSQFIDAFVESAWHVRPGDTPEEVFVRRYFKARPGLEEVSVHFAINTDIREGDLEYAVEVQDADGEGDHLEEAPSTPSELRRRVFDWVAANPRCTSSQLEDGVNARASRVREVRDQLEEEGHLRNVNRDREGVAHAWEVDEPLLDPSWGPRKGPDGEDEGGDP